jgi:hypothetical protein
MTPRTDRATTAWEEKGAELAGPDGALAGKSAVLVTGRDPVAAAQVAIGFGRVASASRRVAIGDLVGDVAPLVALLDVDDVHGVVDSFLYGVSLNKVAQPVTGSDNLFVLPSGTEPVVTEEIFRSDRWRRLASGFREMGATLLLVAPADAPGLDALAGMMDGVVTVGDDAGEMATRFPVLAAVSLVPRRPTVVSESASERRGRARGSRGRPPIVLSSSAPEPSRSRWLLPLLLMLALAAGIGGAWWLREQRRAASRPAPVRRDTSVALAATPAIPAPDTLAMILEPSNPADSANAAAWAIEIAKVSSEEGARLSAQKLTTLPLTSWFPLHLATDPATRWYRVVGGAWVDRAAADSALAALTATGTLELPASVVRAPLALLVGAALGTDSVRVRTARYAQAGIPVYALRQPNGSFNLYTGAFETPEQSMFLALALQKLDVVPTLHFRIGRAP